jgi:hypothetical protein
MSLWFRSIASALAGCFVNLGFAVAQSAPSQIRCAEPQGPAATEQSWSNVTFRCPASPLRALRSDMVHVQYLGADADAPLLCIIRSNSTNSASWLGLLDKKSFPTEAQARALAGLLQRGGVGWVEGSADLRSGKGETDKRRVIWVLEGYQDIILSGRAYRTAQLCRTDERMLFGGTETPDITSQRVWLDRNTLAPIASHAQQITIGNPRQTLGSLTFPNTGLDWEIVEWFRDSAPPLQ